MKKKLSIIEIFLALLAILFPFMDSMFTRSVFIYLPKPENISQHSISLQNLMVVQEVAPGPVVYWIFNIVTALMIIYCIYSLFDEKKFEGKKALIAIPAISFVLNLIMVICASEYKNSWETNGQTRYGATSMELLGYVQIEILAAILIIECYKQYKCD